MRPFRADTVNLLVGHVHALGGVLGGGERSAHTVLDYAVPATVFPSAGYVALGHLHRAQRPGPGAAWYSGLAPQLDFGEAADSKGVLVVELAAGAPPTVEEVPLRAGRRLRTLTGTLAELAAQADEAPGETTVAAGGGGRARPAGWPTTCVTCSPTWSTSGWPLRRRRPGRVGRRR